MANDLVERLNLTSLKEWFIRGPNGGFHKDDAPFEAVAAITRLTDEVAGLHKERGSWRSVAEMNATSGGFTAQQLTNMTARAEAAEARVAALEGANKTLTEAVHRARRHAQNIGIDSGAYYEQLEAALAQAGSKT